MRIGIIEGRLGQPPEARFARAREIGFDAVELSFHAQAYETLPLWTEEGAARVRRLAAEAGVAVPSVCATYFNQYAFASPDAAERERCVEVLRRLIDTAATAGLRTILLPFFGVAELQTPADRELAATMVGRCAGQAAAAGVRLGIEATLPVDQLRAMVALAGQDAPQAVGVYYDVGNVCPAGYDAEADLAALAAPSTSSPAAGSEPAPSASSLRRRSEPALSGAEGQAGRGLLVGVHIKDRKRSGETVPLGQGDVDFAAVARGLRAARYDGYLVLETPAPPPGTDAQAANAADLAFTRRLVAAGT
jgi:hexulose-6-phosphate isomerase